MKFSAAQSTKPVTHTIYVISDLEELNVLDFNTAEKDYINSKFLNQKKDEATINRYSDFIKIVKVTKANTSDYQVAEKLRLKGPTALGWLNLEGAKVVLIKSLNGSLNAKYFAEGLALSSYQFLKYFTKKEKTAHQLNEIIVDGATDLEIQELTSSLAGVFSARDLVNEPVMYLTAKQLAKQAQKAGEKYGFKVEVLNKKKIESLKMGGLLAVNKGSQDPPTFTIMEHKPANAINKKPIVLVGKGVVYDTGGLSLKPTAGSMDLMKSDMGGAAAVIGTMISIASANVPVHVIGLTPATDNRPGEKAYTPGDVITMFDGSTVEVMNTDAEGRMILADALTYAKKYDPELVIDLATLTGAAAVAIGKYGIVAMGNAEDNHFEELSVAGKNVYERLVLFPFWDEYNELLKSPIADMKNIGGREGGAITAGKFLEQFTDYPYVHMDIAGPAFLTADNGYRLKGGSGVGVRLLFNYLKNKA